MPQLIPAAIVTWWGSTVTTIAGWTIYGSTIVKAALLVASYAYSQNQSAKARRALNNAGLDQGRSVMVRDPIAPRRLIYGTVLLSGTVVFIHTAGTKNEFLYVIIILAGHEVDDIGAIYFNEEIVPFDGTDNAATGKYAGFARCLKKRGVPGDIADHYLTAECPTVWTSAHTLSGCAYVSLRLKWSPELFPNGLPTIRALVRGKKVYDPRTGATLYSANSALCAGDFLMSEEFGKGVALARVRSTPWIEAANICDESMVLDGALTEKRYETHGTVNADQDPGPILSDLADAMAGTIIDTGGTWTIRAGAHRASSLTLTDADLISSFSVQPRQSRQDTCNRVRGIYISPQNKWSPADFPLVKNDTYKTQDGDKWLDRDVQFNFTTSPAMAQRLAKVVLERGRQQITCSGTYSLKALALMPGDTVALTRSRLGWAAKLFEVVEWHLTPVGGAEAPALGVELTMRETAAGVWDWANGEETTVDLAPNTTLPDPFTVPTPTGFTLTSAGEIQTDGTLLPRLRLDWNTPNNQYVEQGGFTEIEYKLTIDPNWITWTRVPGTTLRDYLTGGLIAGEIYDVRLRHVNHLGVRGAWASASLEAAGDLDAPDPPLLLTAIAGTGKSISLDWSDSPESDLSEYGIYRSTTSSFPGSAGLIAENAGSRFVDVDVDVGTPYYYWVTAIDRSENESGPSNMATATPVGGAGIDTTPPANPTAPTLSGSGTYIVGDGSIRSNLVINMPALTTGAVLINLLYRRSGGTNWLLAVQSSTGGGTARIDDLSPGVSYEVAAQAFSAYGYGSTVVLSSPTSFTAPNDTIAPFVPGGFTAVAGTGSTVLLDWNDDTNADFSEYAIYRSTVNSFPGSSGKIAETRSSRFTDVVPNIGTWYYWIASIDTSENQSSPSASANAVVTGIDSGDVSSVVGTPGTATKTGDGTYLAGDGSNFAYIIFSIPPVPSGAAFQNLLYKKNAGGGEWLLAAQVLNTGTTSVKLDDLTPGILYDIALQAYNNFGFASAVVPASPASFTAPNKSSAAAGPSSVSIVGPSSTAIPPSYQGIIQARAAQVRWTHPTDKDARSIEIKSTSVADGSGTLQWWGPDGVPQVQRIPVSAPPQCPFYNTSVQVGYINIRSVDRSGNPSAWVYVGDLNAVADIASGSISVQNDNNVRVTGVTTGNGGVQKKVLSRHPYYGVISTSGGTTQTENVSLTGYGFSTRPDSGWMQCADWDKLQARYDIDDSTQYIAVIRLSMMDGSALPSATLEFTGEFVEYD